MVWIFSVLMGSTSEIFIDSSAVYKTPSPLSSGTKITFFKVSSGILSPEKRSLPTN